MRSRCSARPRTTGFRAPPRFRRRCRGKALKLLSPDGLPLVGNALHPRLFVNAGHGPAGWGLACGAAKLVADLIGGVTPDLPGDTLAALRPERFRS